MKIGVEKLWNGRQVSVNLVFNVPPLRGRRPEKRWTAVAGCCIWRSLGEAYGLQEREPSLRVSECTECLSVC